MWRVFPDCITYVNVTCATLPKDHCPTPMAIGNISKYVDTMTVFQKLNQKVNDPKMTFDPTSLEVTCVTLPKNHCIQVP